METRTDNNTLEAPPTEEQESVFHSASHLTRATDRALLEAFVEFFSAADRSSVVLEMGCGDGFWLEVLRNLGYRNVIGIDISPAALEMATQKGLNVRLGDLYQLEVDDVFDIVLLCDTLEHLPDPREALRRAHRALRTRGTLFLAVPVYDSLAEQLERRFRGVSRPHQCQRDDMTHRHAFTEPALHALLDECHFSVESSYRVGNLLPGKNSKISAWTGGGRFGRWLCIVAQTRFYIDFGDEKVASLSEETPSPPLQETGPPESVPSPQPSPPEEDTDSTVVDSLIKG